jgi:hypothetical protein
MLVSLSCKIGTPASIRPKIDGSSGQRSAVSFVISDLSDLVEDGVAGALNRFQDLKVGVDLVRKFGGRM